MGTAAIRRGLPARAGSDDEKLASGGDHDRGYDSFVVRAAVADGNHPIGALGLRVPFVHRFRERHERQGPRILFLRYAHFPVVHDFGHDGLYGLAPFVRAAAEIGAEPVRIAHQHLGWGGLPRGKSDAAQGWI